MYITITPEISQFVFRAAHQYELEFSTNFNSFLKEINFEKVKQENISVPIEYRDSFANSLDIHLQEFEHDYTQPVKDQILNLIIAMDLYRKEITKVQENVVYINFSDSENE